MVSGFDLAPLTTPVAYFTHALAIDTFWYNRSTPFTYVNFQDIARARGLPSGTLDLTVYTRVEETDQAIDPKSNDIDPFGMEFPMQFMDFGYYDNRYDKPPVNIIDVPLDPEHPHLGVTRTTHIETENTQQARLITNRYMLLSVAPALKTEVITRENILIDRPVLYDPTNGTVSTGTIHTLGWGLNLRENRLASPQ